VNSDVVPQSRVRASKAEGRRVLVTGGEYRGLSGKIFQDGYSETDSKNHSSLCFLYLYSYSLTGMIDSCIPGGW
jgi:hypothetical protein